MENQPFECVLRAQPRYQLGEPIAVTFEIRNAGTATYRLLAWDVPFMGEALNFLAVSRGDDILGYDGRLVNRGDPTQRDYITLAPGESRSVEVDISRIYPIQLPGEYTVTLNTVLHDAYPIDDAASAFARRREEHTPHPLERTSVTFVVETDDGLPKLTLGQAARLAEPTVAGREAEIQRDAWHPVVVGGTPAQQADTRTAHAHAVYMVGKAYQQLTTHPGGASNASNNWHYRKWFGLNSLAFPWGSLTLYDLVASNFGGIREVLNVPNFLLPLRYDLTGAGCQPGWAAYTYHESRTV